MPRPAEPKSPAIIGIISDTHGLLRDEAVRALRSSDLIIHAGDVGSPEIIATLQSLAPVVAVKGNTDIGAWTSALPATAVAEARLATIYVLHNLNDLDLDPLAAGFHIVVSGHTHKPKRSERSGILYLNPGSAGPRRFTLPVTIARLNLAATPWQVDFIDLESTSS
ncbi:MAG TPA: metallophosphoesterase family protein [Candidatus Dormibacteraeota bacterium]|nr:metallophosphoesterase family protein [Candidatus Dormibacteraeota bacterium]